MSASWRKTRGKLKGEGLGNLDWLVIKGCEGVCELKFSICLMVKGVEKS